MLPKTNRISRKQWDPLFKSSKKVVFPWGLVRRSIETHESVSHSAPRNQEKHSCVSLRVSIVVSKKVAKLSVDRHIIKRFLYTLFDPKRESPQTFIIHVSNWKFNDQDFLKQVAIDIENVLNKQDKLRCESTQ